MSQQFLGAIRLQLQKPRAAGRAGYAKHLSVEDSENITDIDMEVEPLPVSGTMQVKNLQSEVMQVKNLQSETCSSCGDAADYLYGCKACGKKICVRKTAQNACILVETLALSEQSFLCPSCYKKEHGPLPYVIQSHSLSSNFQTRYLNPLGIQILTHDEASTNYIANMVSLHFREHYSLNADALCEVWVSMRVGASRYPALETTMQPLVRHQGTHKQDFLVIVDGHSDYQSGEVIYGQNKDGDVSDGADGLLRRFMRPLLDTVHSSTGIRGVVLLTCGPSWTNMEHYGRITEIITDGPFDFVLGFGGITVVPSAVVPHIILFLSKVYIQRIDILQAFKDVWGNDASVGIVTPINLIIRDDMDAVGYQIVYSALKTRIWGIAPQCPNPQCKGLPGNITFKTRKGTRDQNHDFASCSCKDCGWGTKYIDRPSWLKPLARDHFFIHKYPLSSEQASIFASQMKNLGTK